MFSKKLLIKQPGAWIPIVMSFAMLAFIVFYILIFGTVEPDPNADEGTAAHLFQIWLVAETLMVAFFAIRWLPQKPKQALWVLTVQIVAVLLACAPVFLLGF